MCRNISPHRNKFDIKISNETFEANTWKRCQKSRDAIIIFDDTTRKPCFRFVYHSRGDFLSIQSPRGWIAVIYEPS